jgi:hypothetical protein
MEGMYRNYTYNVMRLASTWIFVIQSVPGGKVNILGGHNIGHSKQKVYMYMFHCPVHCTDEQHAMSSH